MLDIRNAAIAVLGGLLALAIGTAVVERSSAAKVRADLAAANTSIGTLRSERDAARGLAGACSDAVDDLRELADKRQKEADAARKAADTKARTHEQRADSILAAPPPVAGDACASAQRRVNDWLQGRVKP